MLSIIQRKYAYMDTASCGFIRNTHGGVSIVPKPSAGFIFSPPTKYTTHWVSKEEYVGHEDRDLSGSLLLTDQEGYDCLLITNTINGNYVQIGLWARDPYINHNPKSYKPPKYREPPRPWARSLRTPQLTPVEICCAGQTIPNTYPGWYTQGGQRIIAPDEELVFHTSAPMKPMSLKSFIPTGHMGEGGISRFVTRDYPRLTITDDYTATYAINIAVKFNLDNSEVRPTVLARDCPPPYNKMRYSELKKAARIVFIAYSHQPTKHIQILQITDTNKLPFKEVGSNSYVFFDTELQYCSNKDYEGLNKVFPILWEWPFVLLHPNAPAVGAPKGKKDVQPVVVVPLMVYHEGWKDEQGRENGVLDGRTGKRSARGKTFITYITNASIFQYYTPKVDASPVMYQVSHPITNNPHFDEKSLKDILEPKKKR